MKIATATVIVIIALRVCACLTSTRNAAVVVVACPMSEWDGPVRHCTHCHRHQLEPLLRVAVNTFAVLVEAINSRRLSVAVSRLFSTSKRMDGR